MSHLEWYQLGLIGVLFLWSGVVRSGFGFGGAVFALPFLLLIDDRPLVYLPLIAVHLLIFSSLTVYQNHRKQPIADTPKSESATVDWAFLKKALLIMIIPKMSGIFYIRSKGKPQITGINQKHFPTVTGNGKDTLLTLAKAHYRYTHHWQSFLQDLDTQRIPANGEQVRLSFIGSHTLGCKFTDDLHLLTPELERAIFRLFDDQPGFNFGRVDVKAKDEAALKAGQFVVIEVNGVASLPTHMFDPKFSIFQAYKILFAHAKHLVKIAREHKHKPMELLPYRQILQKVKANKSLLNQAHHQLQQESSHR